MELQLFFTVPILVEMDFPEWTSVAVCLVLLFAVDALECVRTRLTFLCFEPWGIGLQIFFTAPHHLPVVLGVMWSIAFDISGPVCSTCESRVAPFPTVLALWNSRVHVCAMYHSNISSNIESLVDDALSLGPIL